VSYLHLHILGNNFGDPPSQSKLESGFPLNLEKWREVEKSTHYYNEEEAVRVITRLLRYLNDIQSHSIDSRRSTGIQ